jgi:hypothetical protein
LIVAGLNTGRVIVALFRGSVLPPGSSLVRGLEERSLPGVSCHYFDSIGVPSPETMKRDFGGRTAWQEAAELAYLVNALQAQR